ncbi:hypothetical protein HYU06_01705 [Candidatus Woesearchaeota archaeon]|nr:hypothetical protein [Candidatus Woesearchaeota archaeon]
MNIEKTKNKKLSNLGSTWKISEDKADEILKNLKRDCNKLKREWNKWKIIID